MGVEKYIICTLHSVFIHCNIINVILGVLDVFAVWRPDVSGVSAQSAILAPPPVEWTLVVARMVGQQTSLYWLVAESWGSDLPCHSVRGESGIFELWLRIDRGCRVFGNRDRMSRGPGRTILCGLNRARTARCGTLKF
jgi:hypothetical protein